MRVTQLGNYASYIIKLNYNERGGSTLVMCDRQGRPQLVNGCRTYNHHYKTKLYAK